MFNRDKKLLQLRPSVKVEVPEVSGDIETFMHKTLRPILKLQNDLLVRLFIQKISNPYLLESHKERLAFIEKTLSKDVILRNQIIGLVIGGMTVDEFGFYDKHQKELNKRILKMAMVRIDTAYQ